ncbi:uncharacterized protein DUF3558 [Halopolyspora algeriensis]|uniref:Uncharacterized protein DUF3558 n=2 Tax=Halopolyspora algeriensis TaxID=1500506 RepID=A0A368VUC1_9ACTN|nr:uncharacterized protein DUF3558 [Halopolyspora algeriensis]TQM56032.1 uncharacterized protein DUF3558 [Halopolyspora algeriensis]
MWESPDGGGKKIGFTAIDGRSIKTYYKKSHSYTDFEKITVAGHPAVRANKTDPMTGGSCDIYLASKKNQVVYSYARTPKVGEVNPCDLSKQALELSVSSWPTAK